MKEITKEEEFDQLKNEGKKFLINFTAAWCSGCRVIKPTLETLSYNYSNVDFVYVDVDKQTDFALKMGIKGIPTVMIYNGANLIDRTSGAKSPDYYKSILNTL